MAIRRGARSRSGMPSKSLIALSCCGFLAIVLNARDRAEPQITRDEEAPMIDQQIDIPTKDGKTTTFITHPERGGPFPVIIFYMDAPAIREELRDMARRLGTSGYYVMLPNLYYRAGVMEIGPINPDPESPERKRMFQLMNSINIPLVMEDTKALLAYAEGQAAAQHRDRRHRRLLHERPLRGQRGDAFSRIASRRRHRSTAYQSGDRPARQPASCRRRRQKAELYFACAEDRRLCAAWRSSRRSSAGMKGTNNEVEIYPGTHHGFALSEDVRSTTATPPSDTGSGFWRSIAAISC